MFTKVATAVASIPGSGFTEGIAMVEGLFLASRITLAMGPFYNASLEVSLRIVRLSFSCCVM